jgi:hypothetical protein
VPAPQHSAARAQAGARAFPECACSHSASTNRTAGVLGAPTSPVRGAISAQPAQTCWLRLRLMLRPFSLKLAAWAAGHSNAML